MRAGARTRGHLAQRQIHALVLAVVGPEHVVDRVVVHLDVTHVDGLALLQPSEELFGRARDDAVVLGQLLVQVGLGLLAAEHREGLTRAGLAVRETRRVEPLQHALHQRRAHAGINILLLGGVAIHGLHGE